MPSTTSRVVSIAFASSMVMTPSLPTFSIASAMRLPMVSSPFALMMPTWAISLFPLVGLDCFFSSATMVSTATSMPRLMSIGLAPAATILTPSAKIACASTVAVVVPSPAISDVFEATSLTICAPMLAKWSSSSTSLATVTPSLVTVGAPHDRSKTTFRPRGPKVTLTALARVLSPMAICLRASLPKRIALAAMGCSLLLQNREDVVFAQNDVVFTVDLNVRACVFSDEHLVADMDCERLRFAVLKDLAVTDGYDLCFEGLFLGSVGNEQAAGGLFFLGKAFGHNAIVERTNFHGGSPRIGLAAPFVPLDERHGFAHFRRKTTGSDEPI